MPVLPNSRHERFAQAIASGKTADEAYQIAGFSENRGNASRLKANESIMNRVAEIAERAADRAEVDVARVLKELARIGFSDLRTVFGENGRLRLPEEWDDETAASIASIEVTSRTVPGSDARDKEIEHVHKIKMWDKNSALEKIAKHLGMFKETVEHTGSLQVVIASTDADL